MPCGGIYPTLPAQKAQCWQCGKTTPPPDHFCEEWDTYIHGTCVEAFLKTDEGRIVLDHGHDVEVRPSSSTTNTTPPGGKK